MVNHLFANTTTININYFILLLFIIIMIIIIIIHTHRSCTYGEWCSPGVVNLEKLLKTTSSSILNSRSACL